MSTPLVASETNSRIESPGQVRRTIRQHEPRALVKNILLQFGGVFSPDATASIRREGLVGPSGSMTCFTHAQEIAMERDLLYVEGRAVRHSLPCVVQGHAWCVDRAGRTVDPTWGRDGVVYVGVPIPDQLLRHFLEQAGVHYSVFCGMSDAALSQLEGALR